MGRPNWINDTPRPTAQEINASALKAELSLEPVTASTPSAKVTLPSNLPETLKRLENSELQTLFHDVTAEIKRRGQATPGKASAAVSSAEAVTGGKPPAGRSQPSAAKSEVPAGRANLIRASFKAGMKPPAIARMFRISQSVVKRVLGGPEKPTVRA